MRLFVAIYPPPEAVRDLADVVAKLVVGQRTAAGVNVRLAATETWHVTVAFLGEVEEERFPQVASALEQAVSAWQIERAALPTLRIADGGKFGHGASTVLWAGLHGDVASLTALASSVSRYLRRAKLPVDPKPFRPHLTLARPGERLEREEIDGDLAQLRGHAGPSWTVGELVLVRSHLGPHPTYDKLITLPLA
jgi:2'-5' RNA ligase